jgi:hypothetical protein
LNDPKFSNAEYRNAMLALHVGRTLVGQRTSDVLSLLDYVQTLPSSADLSVEIDATGIATLPALLGAVLGHGVKSLTLHGGLQSFAEVLDRPTDKNWYSYVIPRVSKYFDIAEVITLAQGVTVNLAN